MFLQNQIYYYCIRINLKSIIFDILCYNTYLFLKVTLEARILVLELKHAEWEKSGLEQAMKDSPWLVKTILKTIKLLWGSEFNSFQKGKKSLLSPTETYYGMHDYCLVQWAWSKGY